MRCILCKTEQPNSGTESARAICGTCSDELSQSHVPKSKRRRRAVKMHANADVVVAPSVMPRNRDNAMPSQTLRSARAVTKAWRHQVAENDITSSSRKFRIDSAHSKTESIEGVDTGFSNGSRSISGVRHAISFGLIIFIIGQICVIGGFYSGHAGACVVGMLSSIGGVGVSLLSVNEALRRLENR